MSSAAVVISALRVRGSFGARKMNSDCASMLDILPGLAVPSPSHVDIQTTVSRKCLTKRSVVETLTPK